jgi:hypothetical protein
VQFASEATLQVLLAIIVTVVAWVGVLVVEVVALDSLPFGMHVKTLVVKLRLGCISIGHEARQVSLTKYKLLMHSMQAV